MSQRSDAVVAVAAVVLGAIVAAKLKRDQDVAGSGAARVPATGHTDRGGARMLLENKLSPDHYADRRYGHMAEPYEMSEHMFARAHPLSAHVAIIAPNIRALAEHGWGWVARPPSEETI